MSQSRQRQSSGDGANPVLLSGSVRPVSSTVVRGSQRTPVDRSRPSFTFVFIIRLFLCFQVKVKALANDRQRDCCVYLVDIFSLNMFFVLLWLPFSPIRESTWRRRKPTNSLPARPSWPAGRHFSNSCGILNPKNFWVVRLKAGVSLNFDCWPLSFVLLKDFVNRTMWPPTLIHGSPSLHCYRRRCN